MKHLLPISGIILAGSVIFIGWASFHKSDTPSSQSAFAVTPDPTWNQPASHMGIQFRNRPPVELDTNASDQDKCIFAWNEFIALNWKSSYSNTGLRDDPDPNWSWSRSVDPSPAPNLLVWETYAHRSELRPFNDNMLPFNPGPPHYSFGVPLTPEAGSQASFTLWDNLDENNEIGSCTLFGQAKNYGKQYQVLYQAKCNSDEYNYIYNNYRTNAFLQSATQNTLKGIAQDSSYTPGFPIPCGIPGSANVICLPCGNYPPTNIGANIVGAMEVKTAWRPLTPLDDSTKFLLRNVIIYKTDADGSVHYLNARYALIGIHIIHKTYNNPNFVIATWEHMGVQQQHYGYQLLDRHGNDSGALNIDYRRLHPIPSVAENSTKYVHALIQSQNPNSIWLNYRLIGVQTRPTNDSTSFSYFLANYVIESDPSLADFHGSSVDHPFDNGHNTLYNKKFYTMGGCQGCHGAAQTKFGGDMSFLMDEVGKPVDTPDIAIHGSKLQKYIHAIHQSDLFLNRLRLKTK